MDKIDILFVNRSNDNNASIHEREEVLSRIKKPHNNYKTTVDEVPSIDNAKEKLQKEKYDVLIMWVDSKNSKDWQELDYFLEEQEKLYYLGFIVIFNFREAKVFCCRETKVLEIATQTLSRRIFPFFYPINCDVVDASIQALASYMKYHKSLDDLKTKLANATNLNSIVKNALEELKKVGYDRATITLVDNETENFKRYLLQPKDTFDKSLPNRSLQKDIRGDKTLWSFWCKCYLAIRSSQLIKVEYFNFWFLHLISCKAGDKLIRRVGEKNTCIIENLDDIRKEDEEIKQQLFAVLGWDDKPPTDQINSWIGLAAKRPNKKIVAIFTLEILKSTKTLKYKEKDYKLREFLEDFGAIFANAVEDFSLKRNARVIKEILNEMGENLDAEKLVKQILKKLQTELDCDNCNYFLVNYDTNKVVKPENRMSLNEWTSAKDRSPNSQAHEFNIGEGIVGAVFKDGKSRIIPNASEDKEFLPTLDHPGHNFSMLAVPVVPSYDDSKKPNRIIGIICCNKKNKTDHFTVSDRYLVEQVALSTADVIERTRILESLNKITLKMTKHILNPVKRELLEDICKYAMEVTNAGTASIHLLEGIYDKYKEEYDYKSIKEPYYTFPEGEEVEPEPRLDGEGTTDVVIQQKKTVEFSQRKGNFDKIAPDQRQRGVKCKLVIPLIITENKEEQSETKGEQSGNKDKQSIIIGALYLCKYSESQFSEVEEFALELFANKAALIIYGQGVLSENDFSVKAYEKLQEANKKIASTNSYLELLALIAEYSYDLVRENVIYPNKKFFQKNISTSQFSWKRELHSFVGQLLGIDPNNQSNYEVPKSVDESKLPVLVSYVLFLDEGEYHIKAAWPEYELIPLMKKYDNEKREKNGKKGIAGLTIERQNTISVEDIKEHEEKNTEEYREYIKFKETTRSQLSVPILYDQENNNTEKKVLGVINLEYSQPYAFKDFHQKVIEIFAKQIAIAYQKKNLINSIENNNKILKNLHQSLNKITQKSPKNMLYEAVSQTRESFSAKKVIVIPVKKNKLGYLNILEEEIVPRCESWMNVLYKESQKVFKEGNESVWPGSQNNLNQEEFKTGFCIPFSSGEDNKDKIGVMWILFAKSIDREQLEKNKDIYRVYANQIALAYANSKRFEELKIKDRKNLSRRIDGDRNRVQNQATAWFLTSLVTSFFGIVLMINGVNQLSKNNLQNPLDPALITTAIGLLFQGAPVFAYNNWREANRRLDEYHKELYYDSQLNTLLAATEELAPEIMGEEKRKIIETTTNYWLESAKEVSNSNNLNEVKKADK